MLTRLYGRLRRAWSILRQRGLRQLLSSVVRWIRWRSGVVSAEQAAYRDHKMQVDAAFDARLGVTTGGVHYLYDLSIDSPNARYGTNHIASDPGEFELAMARLDIDLATASFVDLGSGRGRALILAMMLPFRRIIGVEFARELHEESIANLQRAWVALGHDEATFDARITPVHADATQFALPEGPLVIYLYNPFDAPIIAAVARNAMTSWQANPRPMRIVYLNPLCGAEWRDAGWRLIEEGAGRAIFAPPLD